MFMRFCFVLSLIIITLTTFADVRMPAIFSENMVLQHDTAVSVWGWANAKIDGDTIVVWNDKIVKPVAVRYAWADNPICNLYNKANLPALPFRTDDWQGITFGK